MNLKNICLIFVLLITVSGVSNSAKLIEANQQIINQKLFFKPKFELDVSEKIAEAINSGIAVTFVVQASLFEDVNWWVDKKISSKIQTFKLHYYSMSRQYQLNNISNDNRQNYASLEQLLEQLSTETEFIFDLDQSSDYIETRIFLDKQALPSTMQLPTVFDQDWNINSDWQQVPITRASLQDDE
jgi:hypothetical protein